MEKSKNSMIYNPKLVKRVIELRELGQKQKQISDTIAQEMNVLISQPKISGILRSVGLGSRKKKKRSKKPTKTAKRKKEKKHVPLAQLIAECLRAQYLLMQIDNQTLGFVKSDDGFVVDSTLTR